MGSRHPTPSKPQVCTCKTLDPELINYHPVVGLNIGHPRFKEARLCEIMAHPSLKDFEPVEIEGEDLD